MCDLREWCDIDTRMQRRCKRKDDGDDIPSARQRHVARYTLAPGHRPSLVYITGSESRATNLRRILFGPREDVAIASCTYRHGQGRIFSHLSTIHT